MACFLNRRENSSNPWGLWVCGTCGERASDRRDWRGWRRTWRQSGQCEPADGAYIETGEADGLAQSGESDAQKSAVAGAIMFDGDVWWRGVDGGCASLGQAGRLPSGQTGESLLVRAPDGVLAMALGVQVLQRDSGQVVRCFERAVTSEREVVGVHLGKEGFSQHGRGARRCGAQGQAGRR